MIPDYEKIGDIAVRFDGLHSVRIEGLEPVMDLCYRVCWQDLLDDSNARYQVFGEKYEGHWQRVKNFDAEAKTYRFSFFNDVHMQLGEYKALAEQVDSGQITLTMYNAAGEAEFSNVLECRWCNEDCISKVSLIYLNWKSNCISF